MIKKQSPGISWWRTEFGQSEVEAVVQAFRCQNISQGELTQLLEQKLGALLDVPHVVAVSNGSSALALALMAFDVTSGDEVIVPNRTWIATAHAVHILGAKVILVDVETDRPVVDIRKIEEAITDKTKVIVPVHLNGRSACMSEIEKVAKKYNLKVVEDAAQALFSRNKVGYLGTQSDIGCFSLSVTKLISTGQGGFVVTRSSKVSEKLRAIRTHGVENVVDPRSWGIPGFNFRITDIQASIGIAQLALITERLEKVTNIYKTYQDGLKDCPGITTIPVAIERGEIPIYNEFLCDRRTKLTEILENQGIGVRPFLPNLSRADYFKADNSHFPNSIQYEKYGLTLPSGPGQEISQVQTVVDKINQYFG